MPWEPARYLAFASERLRPAVDLLARVPLDAPHSVLDLGCGAGNVTRLLLQRWPDAKMLGVDSSAEMLARAHAVVPEAELIQADIATYRPADQFDVVFSNAALHWLGDHASLFVRFASWVKAGGCLAVQMPASFSLPSHTAAYEVAAESPFVEHLTAETHHAGVHAAEDYLRWLAPVTRTLDVWETTYFHVLEGENPVRDWFRSTLLVPYLEVLPEALREPFVEAYGERVRASHPARADGRTVMPMKRLFIVAGV